MDFKRTQILLLIFFIFFDAYLAFTLITKQQVRQTNSGQVTNVSIETQLKNRNIKINQTLSNESYDRLSKFAPFLYIFKALCAY